MDYKEPPQFLSAGTFVWSERGYRYSNPPPVDLLAPGALRSEDPWIVVAATLEQAKFGNHTPIHELANLVRADSPHLVIYACLDLLADAGTEADLSLLAKLMFNVNEDIRNRSCWAAMQAGSMLLVPPMLDAWKLGNWRLRDDLCFLLSMLLEEEWPLDEQLGPIANGASLSYDDFYVLVSARIQAIQAQTGASMRAPIWGGKIFGVVSFTEQMVSLLLRIGRTELATAAFIPLRHKFEASTGIDCSRFYDKKRFQPEAALSILSDFLEDPRTSQYKEGVRYFFGHPIP
jgi:hypothetical protein